MVPDFLIIGAPKCATSWLQSALNQHPCLRMVPDEIEFFSSHVDRPLQWYLDHFKELVKEERNEDQGKRLVLGEKSAGYCGISASRIRLVHRLVPEARLILMVRDPVERHWSHAKRYFQKEKSQERGFRSLDSRQSLFKFFKRTRRFSEFSKIIEMWTKVYPPEQSAGHQPGRRLFRSGGNLRACIAPYWGRAGRPDEDEESGAQYQEQRAGRSDARGRQGLSREDVRG